jgi:hypothetical protein
VGHAQLLNDLKGLVERVRHQAASAVNSALTATFWQVGKQIHDEFLKGERQEYGK